MDSSVTIHLTACTCAQVEWYGRHIEGERAATKEMGESIRSMRERILAQRRNMGGVNAAKESEAMIQKQVPDG
jgi:hypothetical protein